MYPSFVTVAATGKRGYTVLIICGMEYTAGPYDIFIDEAILLASHWRSHQVSYERIVHLRMWLRENYQHGHNLPYKHMRNIRACRYFVEMVIHAEFTGRGKAFEEGYKDCLQENLRVFSKCAPKKEVTP